MKKLFISQPFSSKTEEEVFEIRERALDELENIFHIKVSEYEIIDNYHHPEISGKINRLTHLGRSIQQLGDASLVYFIGEWRDAKGCGVEMEICNRYCIPYIIGPSVEQLESYQTTKFTMALSEELERLDKAI
jgi:hypothetical protein